MAIKKKIHLKAPFVSFLKVIFFLCAVFFVLFLVYRHFINEIKKMGYSESSSQYILFHMERDYVLSIGGNKTLDAAYSSPCFISENKERYIQIDYHKQKNLICNINKMIEKKYSNSDINIILSHGNDEEVTEFVKRDRVRYLEEFFGLSYAKLKYYDRYVQYSDETGEDENTSVLHVNLDMDKEIYKDPTIIDRFSETMLVNKRRTLTKDYQPENLVKIPNELASSDDLSISKVVLDAFTSMAKDGEKEGMNLYITSAYRSYEEQEELVQHYQNLYGENYVQKYVALPGFSEHQTGLAIDIGSRSSSIFASSKEYDWVLNHAYQYGFILRYTKKYEDLTGFREEAWHYRYVGKKIASYIHSHDMSYEEYYVTFLDN